MRNEPSVTSTVLVVLLVLAVTRAHGLRFREMGAREFTPIKDDFTPDFRFAILCQGDQAHFFLTSTFGEDERASMNVFRTADRNEFFDRLAGTLYEMRISANCPGLLPLQWFLYDKVVAWSDPAEGRTFLWRGNISRPEEGRIRPLEEMLRTHTLVWNYQACFGAVCQMKPGMWTRIVLKEEFSLVTFPFRPHVEVKSAVDGAAEKCLVLQAIPELKYEADFTSNEAAGVLAAEFRQNLSEVRSAFALGYSNRHRWKGQWKGAFKKSKQKGKGSGAAPANYAVLLPRHFVTPQQNMSIEEIEATAGALGQGVFHQALTVNGNKTSCLVFNAPTILSGIRKAFEHNWYGDEIHRIERLNDTGGPYKVEKEAGVFESDDPDIPAKTISLVALSGNYPCYWFLDPQGPKEELEKDWRWEALKKRHARATHHRQGIYGGSVSFAEFIKSADNCFLNVLHDCDADFLLLGIGARTRRKIDKAAAEWADLVTSVIQALYDCGTSEGRRRAIRAFDPSLRSQAGTRIDEVDLWVHQALGIFGENSCRVTRTAVETAQRLSLEGKAPASIAISSEEVIVRRWRAYLKKFLKSKRFGAVVGSGGCGEPETDPKVLPGKSGINTDADYLEIVEVVEGLIQNPLDSVFLQEFIEFARECSRESWEAALSEVQDSYNSPAMVKAVGKAWKLCRTADSGFEEGVSRIFQRIQSQAQAIDAAKAGGMKPA